MRSEKRSQGSGCTVGFVPTMGALHQGHLSLLDRSKSENAITVLSIFVNPTQFNQSEDFEKYPRALKEDLDKAQRSGVDFAFTPEYAELYPNGYTLSIQEKAVSQDLEGAFRPGHFNGVLTVVAKLLGAVQPDRMYLGKKDYQQCLVLQKLVECLLIPTEIVVCPVLRESDGLAMSSRNLRLTVEQRTLAQNIYRLGSQSKSADDCVRDLTQAGFRVDYVADRPDQFREGGSVRLIAAWLNQVRLIDCIELPTGAHSESFRFQSTFHLKGSM